ncbi:MAG TPA: type IV toxin-antitoxin system AbiEi family antitoxin domain-containing protein [Solirubrobacterales bacterium]|nr:type IV toxin-antitoxin system AbiEi family antitoxin domain-containing protein [Solirubrobacterales bacterium]
MGQESDTRSRRAWELAARQHGIVTRRQLLALGFGRRSIEHRLARGRLFQVSLGVYAVGWPALNQKRRWMAAALAGGEDAALSHRSAAALWEIGDESGWIAVSVRRRCELRRPGVRFHGRPSLAADDLVLRDEIPVTSPAQTLVDLGTELDAVALERAVNDADKRDLIDPEALREDLPRFGGYPGVRPLRHLLDKLFFRLSDSDLEIYFRRIVKAASLSMPLTKQRVNKFEVDFFWPDLGLVVETDGLRYHRTPSAQLRDARRDRAHVMAGMTPLRFTHYEVRYEPHRVREALVNTMAMLRKRTRF